ncbi:uncharacterized protein LOC143292181 [Babylonia areolata]|uniref:uncharacterized protein LOC143292181 n=1 Tax=Babylonia areolata TaxID=304850 RepID=UPI003FD44DE0
MLRETPVLKPILRVHTHQQRESGTVQKNPSYGLGHPTARQTQSPSRSLCLQERGNSLFRSKSTSTTLSETSSHSLRQNAGWHPAGGLLSSGQLPCRPHPGENVPTRN